MRRIAAVLIISAAALAAPSGRLSAQVRFGLSVQDGEVRDFSLAVGDYYRVPEREVVVVREYGIPDDEVPVVFFISRHSRYEPEAIVRMRLRGESWDRISQECGVPRDAYGIEGVQGPPYGNAYGYYKHHGRPNFYTDEAIVNSVNARILSDRYNCPAPEVVRMHGYGRSYVALNEDFRSHRGGWDRGGWDRGGGDRDD